MDVSNVLDVLETECAELALVQGRLMEVNWACGTAELHREHGVVVPLRFEPALNAAMHRLAMQHVEIRGRGCFNDNDEWDLVCVDRIIGTRAWSEPFDLEAFRNDPNPKVFEKNKMVTIDLTEEEWEGFNRAICEGRDAR